MDHIGFYLKKIRNERNITLSQVAEDAAVSSSLISQIENGKISPSIHTLESILLFYRIPLSEFFRQLERKDIVYISASETEILETDNGGQIILLASKLERNTLESYKLVLPPGTSVDVKTISSETNGERFLLVLHGSFEAQTTRESFALNKGDSINFKSHISCRIVNSSNVNSICIVSGTPPVL